MRVRFTGLRSVTRSVTVTAAVSATLTLTELATELAGTALAENPAEHEITLVAISASNLVRPALQLELPLDLGGANGRPASALDSARWALDRSVDAVRARFGREAVGYAAIVFSDAERVPEAFRELAEHQLSSD